MDSCTYFYKDVGIHLLSDYDIFIPKTRQRRKNAAIENEHNTPTKSTSRWDGIEMESTQFGHADPTPELTTYGGIKLGWIQGVLIPCLLNIWGVMLFLRIAWIVAQAGVGLTIVIIFLSGIVCVITTLSLSAICTNGQLQGGGVYYLVSRSLGAELGASVGIIFAFANAVAASMNTIGFCDSLNELLKSHGLKIIDNSVNDVRIVGAIALLVMCIICAIGMDWETKTQNFLIVVIVLAIFNYIIGAVIGPTSDEARAQGFVGINMDTAAKNWKPDFRYSEGEMHDFFSVFAMYFPAVTGVQAGANICGDLKNPAIAIPKGTILALGISMTSYLTMAVLCGVAALRDASGNPEDISSPKLGSCAPNCKYGLHNSYEIMQLMALWGPLIYAGCWAATLSTALTNLLSVPRLIQALGVDRIYPGLIFFSKPYGRHGEPYRGYVLTFFVSLLFLMIADLNTIAPLITNFYLASYALINFCTFHAALVHHISWRPSFRCYNTWLSLSGFLMCLIMMMIISWVMALITVLIFLTLYLLVVYRKPVANWGSSTDAQRYIDTISSIIQMTQMTEISKSYNPQLLVLAGSPYLRPALLNVAHLITKVGSFMIVVDIRKEHMNHHERVLRSRFGNKWLYSNKFRGLFVTLDGSPLLEGTRTLLQVSGLGRLTPNILFLGYKNNWQTEADDEITTYVRVIQLAFEEQVAVTILRMPEWARPLRPHIPSVVEDVGSDVDMSAGSTAAMLSLMLADSNEDIHETDTNEPQTSGKIMLTPIESKIEMNEESKRSSRGFKQLNFTHNSTLDAWWLYDDGGLNILLPYIIARHGVKMQLRIFALARIRPEVPDLKAHIELLLKKLRIEYTSLTILSGVKQAPSDASWELFNGLVRKFKTTENSECLISEDELTRQRGKSSRHLRLRELLLEHSNKADFIVMTLPQPRKGLVSAALYMSWLEVLSKDLPPTLFVRGNDASVIAV